MYISFLDFIKNITDWFVTHGPRIITIFFVSWFLLHFLNRILDRFIRKLVMKSFYTSKEEEEKRENTLIKISHGFFGVLIWVSAIVLTVNEFGVPVAPLVTGAGILGVAIGFGSQSLVKDIITGLFIIIENQYRIGDVICVDKYCGTVEDMTLRITKLRNIDGTIHYIPNGEIKIASNKSKDYSKVDFRIGVGYHTNIDHLEKIINNVGEEITKDERFSRYIIEAPHFLRIEEFGDYAINIHITGKVKPKSQYLISGELRRRLKLVFEENDIEIPYPIRVIKNV